MISNTFVIMVFLMMIFHPGRIQICLSSPNSSEETTHCGGCSSPEHTQITNEDTDYGMTSSHHDHEHLEIEPILLLPDSNRVFSDAALLSFIYISAWSEFFTLHTILSAPELRRSPYPPLEAMALQSIALGFTLPVRC